MAEAWTRRCSRSATSASTQLVTAPAERRLIDATRLLRQHRVRRLIVTDEPGRSSAWPRSRTSRRLTREFGELVFALRGATGR